MASRARVRSSLATLLLAVAAVACARSGGSSGGGSPTPTITPTPAPSPVNHTFVVSAIDLPTSASEGTALGFDLDGVGGIDNRMEAVFAGIGSITAGLDMQAAMNASVDRGLLVFLANVSAPQLASTNATFQIFFGTTAMTPAACVDINDTVCRHQFSGNGAFAVDAAAPASSIAGVIDSHGMFTGSAATVSIPFSVLGSNPFPLELQRVRAQLSALDANGWAAAGSKIGGAIPQTELDTVLLPAFANRFRALFAADCTVGGNPPGCGCVANSTGATLRNLFDKSPTQDCTISDAEVQAVMNGFTTPDIDLNGDLTPDAISIGIGVQAVPGTFTVP